MKQTSEERGVSLVELILVLGILALIAAVTAPRLSGFAEGRKYIGEWNRLIAVLRYARSEAISRATPIEIQFDSDRRSYGIVEAPAKDQQAAEPNDSIEGKRPAISEHVLPKKLAFDFPDSASGNDGGKGVSAGASAKPANGIVSILFLPDGSVDDESPKILRLVEEDGKFCRVLEQDPVKGYAAFKKERP